MQQASPQIQTFKALKTANFVKEMQMSRKKCLKPVGKLSYMWKLRNWASAGEPVGAVGAEVPPDGKLKRHYTHTGLQVWYFDWI